jgi:hypothetical protein
MQRSNVSLCETSEVLESRDSEPAQGPQRGARYTRRQLCGDSIGSCVQPPFELAIGLKLTRRARGVRCLPVSNLASRRHGSGLTYQLSGRPEAHEYAPHVRSRSECARLRLTRTGHGPLQRKLDPPAPIARSPAGTRSAAHGPRRRHALANEASAASQLRSSKPRRNM